ncbi:MAG: hypothetical protein ACKO14_10885 [Armatimonadota bacterium]
MPTQPHRHRTRERRKRKTSATSSAIPINRRQWTVFAITAVVAAAIALVKPLRSQLVASLKGMSTSLQPELVAIIIVIVIGIYMMPGMDDRLALLFGKKEARPIAKPRRRSRSHHRHPDIHGNNASDGE